MSESLENQNENLLVEAKTAEELKADQEEIDSRSVYVGNVDYSSTPEQLENFFNKVGTINRITILFDRFTGYPKGYAYVEFESKDSVDKAIALTSKEFRGRELRVTTKRTNVPGLTKRRGGFRGRGFRGRGTFRGRGRGSFRGRGRGNKGGLDKSESNEESTSTDASNANANANANAPVESVSEVKN